MKITKLPDGTTTIELNDTPSDVVGENTSSGDPVATEKRAGQASKEPTPAAKPPTPKLDVPTPEPVAEAQPKSEEKPQPAASNSLHSFDLQGGRPDILDPNKGKPGYFYFVAPKEE
jgi:outer membrane biosynthesis protein TonB